MLKSSRFSRPDIYFCPRPELDCLPGKRKNRRPKSQRAWNTEREKIPIIWTSENDKLT